MHDAHTPLTLSNYVAYLKKLSAKYHDNVPLDKAAFLTFLVDVVSHYKLIDTSKFSSKEYEDLQQSLSNELY